MHGEEHVYSYILFSPALPKCFSISISNDSYTLTMLLSPALTSVLPYMHESSHMCYVLVERSARLELDGYDLVVWHVVLEAFASDTR